MPTPLPQISSRAWEHPADRAALNTLRAIPGFDEVVRRSPASSPSAASASSSSPTRCRSGPRSGRSWTRCSRTSAPRSTGRSAPSSTSRSRPKVNAYAIGFEHPFIVITSGALELLDDDDERRFLLAHELGHIMSGHMTYRTDRAHPPRHRHAGRSPSRSGSRSCPSSSPCSSGIARASSPPTAPACSPCRMPLVAQRVFMKLAGGPRLRRRRERRGVHAPGRRVRDRRRQLGQDPQAAQHRLPRAPVQHRARRRARALAHRRRLRRHPRRHLHPPRRRRARPRTDYADAANYYSDKARRGCPASATPSIARATPSAMRSRAPDRPRPSSSTLHPAIKKVPRA